MKLRFCLSCLAGLLLWGCKGTTDDIPEETISFHECKEVAYGDFLKLHEKSLNFVILDTSNDDFLFSYIDKIVLSEDYIYILDWISRRILIFDHNGNPVRSLSKRGRGPGEYLQISDFDVDENGSIWVIDGQSDILLKYSPTCEFIESQDLKYEIHALKCRNAKFLMGLAAWDTSHYKGAAVLSANEKLDIEGSLLSYPEDFDENYSLPTSTFNVCDNGILYHLPINDYVYLISDEHKITKKYHFDFGDRSVPSYIRSDIEKNIDELNHYMTLVSSIHIDESYVIGSIWKGGLQNFAIDRKQDILYIQNDTKTSPIIGMSENRIVWQISPNDADMLELLPEEIRQAVEKDETVLMFLNL